MTAADNGELEEVNEVGLVSPTDAIVYPRTMVVHSKHTPVALATMMGSWSLESLADFAVLKAGFLFWLLERMIIIIIVRNEEGVV